MPYFCLEKIVRQLNDAAKAVKDAADVSYHDPHVPELPQFGLTSVEDPYGAPSDLAVIVTAHPGLDYARIARTVPQTLDLRGVTHGLEAAGARQL